MRKIIEKIYVVDSTDYGIGEDAYTNEEDAMAALAAEYFKFIRKENTSAEELDLIFNDIKCLLKNHYISDFGYVITLNLRD